MSCVMEGVFIRDGGWAKRKLVAREVGVLQLRKCFFEQARQSSFTLAILAKKNTSCGDNCQEIFEKSEATQQQLGLNYSEM